jgi:hypothetical protein
MSNSRRKLEETEVESASHIKLEELKVAPALVKTRKVQNISKLVSYITGLTVFTFFLTPRSLVSLLTSTFRFAVLPLAILSSAINWITAVKQYHEEKVLQGTANNSTLMNLAIETIVAAGIITAVIAALATTAAIAVFTPALIIATVGLKAVFDIGRGIFELASAYRMPGTLAAGATEEDIARKDELYNSGTKNILMGAFTALTAITVGLISFTGLAAYAYLGLIAAVGSAVTATIYKNNDTQVNIVEMDNVDSSLTHPSTQHGSSTGLLARHGLKSSLALTNGINVTYGPTYDTTTQRFHKDARSGLETSSGGSVKRDPATGEQHVARVRSYR